MILSNVAILHHLYGEIVGKPWELSGVSVFPRKRYYFSLVGCYEYGRGDRLWVSITFGCDNGQESDGLPAKLLLYDPAYDGTSGHHVSFVAFDDPPHCEVPSMLSKVMPFESGFHDPHECEFCKQIIERVHELRLLSCHSKIVNLLALRKLNLTIEGLTNQPFSTELQQIGSR